MKPRILIVDDERNIRRTLSMILKSAGYTAREAASGEAALSLLEEESSDLILLDVGLPGKDGVEILRELHADHPEIAVVMISGQATVSIAVESTRLGAFDVLEKPLSKDRVLIAVRNALEVSKLGAEVDRYRRIEETERLMLGESAAMEEVRALAAKVAPTGATVLITGESGSGKEMVARLIHDSSTRASGPFIRVNCAAIPEELIETELFGCVRGAYTGADRSRDGKFLLADGGSIFLDEIGDMSLRVQAKVLRVLQEREIERVGDSQTIRVEVRVIAATNKDLPGEVDAGRFREDLFFRLNVVPLVVPPLRRRPDDIDQLSRHFLECYARENGTAVPELDTAALRCLEQRPWRGNVRELKNVIERLAILAPGPVITLADIDRLAPESGLPRSTESDASREALEQEDGFPLPSLDTIRTRGGLVQARREFERRCIEASLQRTDGNISQAAQWLGIERSNLHKKMLTYGLDARPGPPDPTSGEDT